MNALRIICCASRGAVLLGKSTNGAVVLERRVHWRLEQRLFASKKDEVFKLELPREGAEKKEPKYRSKTEDYKQKIYLKDVNGRMLGLKTREEAKVIAAKNNFVLIEDDQTKKIPTLKLANPRKLADEEESSSSSSDSDSSSSSEAGGKAKARQAPKQMIFSAKLTDHDFHVKIRQVKKWVAKGQETMIKVMGTGDGDATKLELIDKELERVFNQPAKVGTKINQRRLTARELKLNVVPVDLGLIAASIEADTANSSTDLPNLDQLDPNQLLNDENILNKLDSDKSKK